MTPAPKVKPNVVIFCGAGFSASLGIPTMARFADRLRESEFLTGEEQASLDHVQATCDTLASVIGTSARNLEQLASFLQMLAALRPDYRFSPSYKELESPTAVSRLLRSAIAFMARPDLVWPMDSVAGQLCRLTDQVNLTFVTTNYDLHIELAALATNRTIRPTGIAEAPRPRDRGEYESLYNRASNAGEIGLLKLHGSVNWQADGDAAVANGFVRVLEWQPTPTHQGRGYPSRFVLAPFTGNDSDEAKRYCRETNLVLVPPEVLKPAEIQSKIVRDQWQGAARAIAEAHRLWFIGYSFPETDSFMRYFLGASLFENARLRQIVVVDPDFSSIARRAYPLFAAPRFREVFQAVPLRCDNLGFHMVLEDRVDEIVAGGMHEVVRKEEARAVAACEMPAHRRVAQGLPPFLL